MTSVRGLALNSRMIFAFLVVELLAILALDSYAYRSWKDVKLESLRKSLVSQVDQLAQQALDLPESTIKLKPVLPYVFQVVSEEPVVLWDSIDLSRVDQKILTPHFLLAHALKNPIQKDLIEFDDFYGAFKRNSSHKIALGAVSKKSIEHDQNEFYIRLLLISFLIFSLSLMIAVLLVHWLNRPFSDLVYASRPFVKGQFPQELPDTKTGEVGELTQAFDALMSQIKSLQHEGIEKVQIEQEVDIAASLQHALLPKEHLETDRYQIESYYESALKTGGDYWGYFETKKYLVMYIADATGHGLSAAMVTSAARGCFSALQQLLTEFPEVPALPSFLLRFANQAILNSAQDELNMTMFIATYSFDEKKLYYASAGHNAGWTINQRPENPKLKTLNCLGSRLGESTDFEAPLDQSVDFSEGDLLFLYTDGLQDAVDGMGQPFGRKRAKRDLLDSLKGNRTLSASKKVFVKKLKEYRGDAALPDDISFLLFKPKRGIIK